MVIQTKCLVGIESIMLRGMFTALGRRKYKSEFMRSCRRAGWSARVDIGTKKVEERRERVVDDELAESSAFCLTGEFEFSVLYSKVASFRT